ncbi:uncharacterized protein BX663DRAFT_464093 [Cokeromyces recurvatus]|uniref:uncharacterized protein n=1 Tax=Cokeromyces recurvatus TaxID=90255 RepID=UPI002220CC3F|nr:uncharacterized protein BX663DRAFT_464093 [Cokeromyces recurvatus]KAI7907749.1 hypothetical protein BX663DRAFT_464093 [Cokeromyces recurvatus]
MSPLPPLGSHENSSTNSIVKTNTNMPLLPSSKHTGASSTNKQNEQPMDLFLNHTAEYNAQELGFVNSNVLLTHEPNNIKVKQESASQQQTESFKLTKKGKQKSKETGHSSLLQVFTNPLLHAIPLLARNCLNFEDFLAQTSLPGQSLLGPEELENDTDANLASSPIIQNDSPWHIRVLGLPHTGAKSRVETQIKICLQLVDTKGELATNWSHIKLPEHLVAKDKLKRKNQKYGTEEHVSPADTQVLILEAGVICDSQPDNEIIMCTSCVHRERKRLKRKRDNKVARAVNKEGGAAKIAALFANDLPDLSDENIMAEERKKIILFNCNEYVDFNTGETTLPTRITCYCRHHSEKTGFRLKFTLRDNLNHVIAIGRSPPIMITDDHKSSKMQLIAAKKRARTDLESESDAPSTSKRKSATNGDAETDSGVSSPIVSTPATPSSQLDDLPESSVKTTSFDNNNSNMNVVSTTVTNNHTTPSTNYNQPYLVVNNQQHPLAENNQGHFISQLQQPQQHIMSSTNATMLNNTHHSLLQPNVGQMPQNELLDFLNSNNLSMLPDQQHPIPDNQQQIVSHFDQNTMMQNNINMHVNNNRRRTTIPVMNHGILPSQQQPYHNNNNIYTKLQERHTIESSKIPQLPRLHRLIPSEGPIYGGSEVTVLGSNFYEGLTCMFGENPAIPTHCWSANTLLCILPPAATAGPVVVSFKEHPLMLEGQDVVLFTYFDESDRALMELALQVVGLKTMGKVEDARQIAMRIVQGDNNNNNNNNNHGNTSTTTTTAPNHHRSVLTHMAANAIYDNAHSLFLPHLEELVASSMLALHNMNSSHNSDYLSLTNRNQHSLLHLATICGHVGLVKTLIKLDCNVNQVDKNGFTALHFASWSGKVEIVELLIDLSNLKLVNRVGKTAERLAIEAGHKRIIQLFRRRQQQKSVVIAEKNTKIPLTDFILSDLVGFVTSILPTSISNLLSSLYTFSTTTSCGRRLTHSATQVYNFMLDPF